MTQFRSVRIQMEYAVVEVAPEIQDNNGVVVLHTGSQNVSVAILNTNAVSVNKSAVQQVNVLEIRPETIPSASIRRPG